MKLGREGDADKVAESFALAQDEIMRMSRLVDNALKMSSLQELGGQHTALDIGGILHTTAEAYRALLEKQSNTLTLRIDENLSPLQGSTDGMVQLFSNLPSNAGAHTQNGEIIVSAGNGNGAVVITVADDGEGIPPGLLPHVLERGVSGSGGSGLGLAIAKEITEAHGGGIAIASEPGTGTTVTLTLPVQREEADHA